MLHFVGRHSDVLYASKGINNVREPTSKGDIWDINVNIKISGDDNVTWIGGQRFKV